MRNVTPFQVIPYAGGKITRPGIYSGVPIKLYHGDICAGFSISSGGTRKIESKNLEHFYKEFYGNPTRTPPAEKQAWVFGRAAHTLLLGEEGFRNDFRIRPETYPDDPSKAWHGGAKSCKAFMAQAVIDNISVLGPDDVPKIRAMAERLTRHPVIQQGILNGLVEHSIFWRRRIKVQSGRLVTIWCKARPDAIPMQSNMLVDYKTCEDAGPQAVRRAIGDHGYHQQLALGAEGIFATTGRKITDHVLVFQETGAPHSINIKPVDLLAIEAGRRQNLRSMIRFAEAIDTGNWDGGYEDDGTEAGLPEYLSKRLANEAESLLLPVDTDPDFAQDEDAGDDEAV